MLINHVKEKLKKGEKVLGSFISFYSPNLIEMIGYAGFDFVIIDEEHGAFSHSELENMIRTAEGVGVVPIVRVSYDQSSIQKALDRGAMGIQIPMVNSQADALEVVKKAKFSPLGKRGVAYSHRAARYGKDAGESFLNDSDQNIIVLAHIETMEAVRNLNKIANVEGIDGIFIGTTDLSVDMGYKKEGAQHPEVQKVLSLLYRKALETDMIIGTVASDVNGIQESYKKGAHYVGVVGNSIIMSALESVVKDSRATKQAIHP